MALELIIDSVEGLDDNLKSLYVEKDGKYQLDVKGVPDTSGIQSQLDALKAKNEELLGETKAAKKARKDAEEAARTAAEEALKQNGDYKSLYESSQEKYNGLSEEFNGLKGTIANEKRNNAAMEIATKLADGANAKILSRFVAERIKFTDEGLKVTDAAGNLTVSTIDDLANEFKNNSEFASLLKGNQSSGGGAGGANNSGGAARTITRKEFDALDAVAKSEFTKKGGKITDS